MQLKVIVKWLALVGAAIVMVSSVLIIFLPDTTAVNSTQSVASVAQMGLGSKLPVRLIIPAIKVDADIESLGLAPDGSMAVPKGPDDVAWFNQGPRPGENGTSVIAGHEGWKDNIPAVFDDLYKLKKGDTISVEDETGTTTVFVVRESQTFSENENAASVFSSSDGRAHLNLITCEGTWDEVSQSYSNRLVVFTDKVE
jgi:LPXTG-site transpeptidase (sortase) family protein